MSKLFDEKGRYEELDSLRGFAALSVVFGHHLLALPAIYATVETVPSSHGMDWIYLAPMHALWDGHAAVILFFVLSGFVLSLPFHRGRSTTFAPYVVKRIARIYPAYWVAISVAIVLGTWIGGSPVEGLSRWFNRPWSAPATPRLIVDHLLLVPTFKTNAFDPVLWSLVHEVRISLIFPLIMAWALRVHWGLVLTAGLLSSLVGWGWSLVALDRSSGSLPLTLQYSVCFVAGAVLAGHRSTIIGWYRGISCWGRIAWACAAILLYDYAFVAPRARFLHRGPTNDYAICVGSMMLIVVALGSAATSRILRHRVSVFLGRISYSLYLVHAIVLLTVVRLLHDRVSLAVLLPCSIAISLVVSTLLAIAVETPSITIGRVLADRVANLRVRAPIWTTLQSVRTEVKVGAEKESGPRSPCT